LAVIVLGTVVMLDGTQSYDIESDPMTYCWVIIQQPAESSAALDDLTSSTTSFVADVCLYCRVAGRGSTGPRGRGGVVGFRVVLDLN